MSSDGNCLAIRVAKLKKHYYVDDFGNIVSPRGAELPDNDDPDDSRTNTRDLSEWYDDYVDIGTIAKLTHDRKIIKDEGGVRIIYVEHTISVTAILTADMEFGLFIDGPGGAPLPFEDRLQKICHFLTQQGMAINFRNFPNSMRKMVPSNEERRNHGINPLAAPVLGEYEGMSGWLVDSHNGPITENILTESLAGGDSVMLTWTFTAKTAHADTEAKAIGNTPRISSELRLDVGDDGDLVFIVSGTIYADSLREIYRARDYLEIHYQPSVYTPAIISSGPELRDDEWSIINGFKKTVTFNIEKNGRSATFNIKYTQVKSNNAFPLGIRDIEFDQELESTLVKSGPLSKGGFHSWALGFRAKITIPPRMDGYYIWYIVHLMIQQQLRNSNFRLNGKHTDQNGNPIPDGQLFDNRPLTGQRFRPSSTKIRCFPVRLKIKHRHYGRQINIDADYILLSPLSHVLNASCIFNRLNNDYQKQLNIENGSFPGPYEPISLSAQWHAWNRSTDISNGFDPNSNDPNNPAVSQGRRTKPHRDTSGTEIVDTGHDYNPLRELEDQARQQNVLISTVIDPTDRDSYYYDEDGNLRDPFDSPSPKTSMPENFQSPGNKNERVFKIKDPITPFSLTRDFQTVDPEQSWVSYDQEYELRFTNPTNPVESVANIDKSFYENPDLYDQHNLGATPDSDGLFPPAVDRNGNPLPEFAARRGTHIHGQLGADDPYRIISEGSEYEDPEERAGVRRETYASTPGRCYLTVRGSAIRVGHKIPIPSVVTIAGQKAIRVGDTKIRQKDISSNADVPVYQAMWMQTYTVDTNVKGEDILNTIEDTGASILYA